MEQHRANPSCAVCHAKLDPLGFGLENFDAIGAWRTGRQVPDRPVRRVARRREVQRARRIAKGPRSGSRLVPPNLAEKMLTFALGRGLEWYDRCTVDDIVANLKKGEDRFSALMIAVVSRTPS